MSHSDAMDPFGLSVNQASNDLNCYIGLAPHNMAHDKSARTCVCGSGFKPQSLEPDASRDIAQLRSAADRILDREDFWMSELPPRLASHAMDRALLCANDFAGLMADRASRPLTMMSHATRPSGVLYRDRECRVGGRPMEAPNLNARDIPRSWRPPAKLVDRTCELVRLRD